MPLISLVSEGDWEAVNQNFARINAKLDETAAVTHDSIILTGLTAGGVVYTDSAGELTTDTGFTFSSGLLTITNDGSPQLRLNSDGIGYVTLEGAGSSLYISFAGTPGGALFTNGAVRITDHTVPQLYLTYSDGNTVSFDVDSSGDLTINPTGTQVMFSSSTLSQIGLIYVDNLSLNGNTLSSVSGDLNLTAASNAVSFGNDSLTTTGTISGINVTSGVDPGHTHSASSITEADTLATVVARGASAGATINVGAGDTLTLASGSITDITGAISFGNENLTTTGIGTFGEVNIGRTGSAGTLLAIGTTDDAISFPSFFEIKSSVVSPTPAGITSGFSLEPIFVNATGLKLGAYIHPVISGVSGATFGWGLFGGIESNVDTTNQSLTLLGLDFEASHRANFTGATILSPKTYDIRGLRSIGRLGYKAKTISNKVNAKAYGGCSEGRLDGIYNSTYANGTVYGFCAGTYDDGIDSTIDSRSITAYGLYIEACASKTFTGGGGTPGTLTSWGLYQSSDVVNAINGKLRINDVLAPTEDFEVAGTSLFLDKVGFSQADMNEYIDSLADGYLDLGATLGFRFNNNVEVTGDISATGRIEDTIPVFNVLDYGAAGDGVADDTAEIQAAIDAAEAAGGGTVYFPEGTYAISAPVTVDSNYVRLMGEGYSSRIVGSNTGSQIYVNTVTFFYISDLYISGNGTYSANKGCINVESSTQVLIERCFCTASSRMGIRINDCSKVTIMNNRCFANYHNGIMVRGTSYDISVRGNTCYDNVTAATSCGIGLYGATGCVIADNICYGNALHGISFEASADRNVVIGNNIYDNDASGISLHTSGSNLIVDNRVYANPTHGIVSYISSKNCIKGNYVMATGTVDTNTFGIFVTTDSGTNVTDNSIIGNFVVDGYDCGIVVDYDCNFTSIINNTVINNADIGIWIRRANVEDTMMIGNYSYNNTTSDFTDVGTRTNINRIQDVKAGATQAGAGALANETWVTSSHASLPDNVVMLGV